MKDEQRQRLADVAAWTAMKKLADAIRAALALIDRQADEIKLLRLMEAGVDWHDTADGETARQAGAAARIEWRKKYGGGK